VNFQQNLLYVCWTGQPRWRLRFIIVYLLYVQCCGSGSGSVWIRIDFRLDPDPGGQKWPAKKSEETQFHVLKCWMSSFVYWRLLCSLDFLHGCQGIKTLRFLKKKMGFLFCCNYYNFWSSKLLIWIRIRSHWNQCEATTLLTVCELWKIGKNIYCITVCRYVCEHNKKGLSPGKINLTSKIFLKIRPILCTWVRNWQYANFTKFP
jgi:hypothetical protein